MKRFSLIVSSVLFMVILAACILPAAIAVTPMTGTNTTLSVVTNTTPTEATSTTPTEATNLTRVNSEIWSGYVAKGEAFTSVEATWQVPTLICPADSSHDLAGIWVGLDAHPTVEQDGLNARCNGTTANYTAFWEMFANPGNKVGTFFTVSPGDIMFASVQYINGMYALQVTDKTSGKTSTTLQSCYATCQHNTAEWIVERPSLKSNGEKLPVTLANFSQVIFTGVKAATGSVTGGISAFRHQADTMVYNGNLLSTTSDLVPGSDGTTFTVTWHASQ